MKRLSLLMIFILLSTLVIASHISEINNYQVLEKTAEEYLGNHNVKLVEVEYNRELDYEKDLTILKINIKYKKLNDNKLIVYDSLPKSFISNAEKSILDTNTNYKIFNDTIVIHYIDNFKEDFTIEYIIIGDVNYNVENFPEPIFFKSINLPDSRLLVFLLIIFGIIFIFYIIQKIKKVKLKGVRIR